MQILLVENDNTIAFFVVNILKEIGFLVYHVTDGEDGLHRVC